MKKPGGTKTLSGIIAIVDAFGRTIRETGAEANADRLALLTSDLSVVSSDKLTDFKKRVGNVELTSVIGEHEQIASVLPLLSALGELARAMGARGVGADLRAFATMLGAVGILPLGRSSQILAASPLAKPRAKAQTQKVGVVEDARTIAERLTKANSDDHEFKKLTAELRGRGYQKKVVEAAANIFLGHDANWSYRSKDEAIKKIEARHALDAITDSRQRTINRINA